MQMPESATHANSPAFSVEPVLERIQQSEPLANSHVFSDKRSFQAAHGPMSTCGACQITQAALKWLQIPKHIGTNQLLTV